MFSCKVVKSFKVYKQGLKEETDRSESLVGSCLVKRLAESVVSLMTILLFLGRILQERLSACYSVVFVCLSLSFLSSLFQSNSFFLFCQVVCFLFFLSSLSLSLSLSLLF